MTIKVYSGRTGSGKSYNSVANVIIPALKQKRTIVTNVVLNKQQIYKDFPDANIFTIPMSLSKDDAQKYFKHSNFPSGSVFVIDEAGKLFPSGWTISHVPTSVLEFFTEHRHVVSFDGKAVEIFLLVQDTNQLAKFVKDLVDSTYIHTKLDKAGLSNHFTVDIYDGAYPISASNKSKTVDSLRGRYKADIFKYYKSYTKSDSVNDVALEQNPDNRSNYLRRIKLYFFVGIVVSAVAVWGFISVFRSMFFNNDVDIKENVDVEDVEDVELGVSTSKSDLSFSDVRPNADTKSSFSDDYRLSGVIITDNNAIALVDFRGVTRKYLLLEHCKYEQSYSDWVCNIENQIVASWTGKKNSQLLNLGAVRAGADVEQGVNPKPASAPDTSL